MIAGNRNPPTFPRVPPDVCERAKEFSTPLLHESAGRQGALPSAIKAVRAGPVLAGPAFTVQCSARDNIWLHRALAHASRGDVLVVSVANAYEAGYWGEIMTCAAEFRGIAGLVIDGCVRDHRAIFRHGFPVYCRGFCLRGTDKDLAAKGAFAASIRVGDADIEPGDLIVGDDDGVLALPRRSVFDVIDKAEAMKRRERCILSAVGSGQTTMEAFGLQS